jgi:hypothetical protein
VPGIHAYADKLSAGPRDTINFYVSSDSSYTMQIFRLGPEPDRPICDQADPDCDVSMSDVMPASPSPQPIHPGSYVHIENGLAATANLTALTLECWVRPSRGRSYDVFNYSGLITQCDLPDGAGYGLFVRFAGADVQGNSVAFYLGDSVNPASVLEVPVNFTGRYWQEFKWHHVVATWDGATKKVWIDGTQKDTQSYTGSVVPGSAPLRLAASGVNGEANHFLNGDLAMPVIYDRALSEAEILGRFNQQFDQQKGVQPPTFNGVLACWPLSEEKGDDVADVSLGRRSGRIINHATWQIGGPSFKNAEVPRFGNYNPATDPARGHGLRFASDDLFDCGWQVTQTYTVPANARSGIYVARLRYPYPTQANPAQEAYYHVTFIVQKPNTQKRAPILMVCPTNTWLAYNSKPFLPKAYQDGSLSEGVLFKEKYAGTERRSALSAQDVPQYSAYLGHQIWLAPQLGYFVPGYHFGRLLPKPGADPYVTYGSNEYSHLLRGTRFTQAWLDKNGYAYDVICDSDLDSTPGILQNYQTVLLAGHSEYWSSRAYHGVQSYLRAKGRLIVLSGNTMYWRVSFSPDGTVMECRKVEGAGELIDPSRRGEAWHSDDGLRGGLMRECGFPGWQLTGLETFGILNVDGPTQSGPPAGDSAFATFHVTAPDHFLFDGLKVTLDQGFAPHTIGHECDVRVVALKDFQDKAGLPDPNGATPPVEPLGITTLALGRDSDVCCFLWDYFLQDLPSNVVDRIAEVIYWERPDGGRVFNGGAIGNGIALLTDSIFDGLMRNVLSHFLG